MISYDLDHTFIKVYPVLHTNLICTGSVQVLHHHFRGRLNQSEDNDDVFQGLEGGAFFFVRCGCTFGMVDAFIFVSYLFSPFF